MPKKNAVGVIGLGRMGNPIAQRFMKHSDFPLLVWDVSLQPCAEDKTLLVYPLTITLPRETIHTGYGTACPDSERTISTYKDLAERHGFTIVHEEVEGPAFFLELEAS